MTTRRTCSIVAALLAGCTTEVPQVPSSPVSSNLDRARPTPGRADVQRATLPSRDAAASCAPTRCDIGSGGPLTPAWASDAPLFASTTSLAGDRAGRVFWGTAQSEIDLTAFAADGTRLFQNWRQPRSDSFQSNVAGEALVASDFSRVVRMNPDDGSYLWERWPGGDGSVPPDPCATFGRVHTGPGNTVLVTETAACGVSPSLTAIDKDTGQAIWRRPMDETPLHVVKTPNGTTLLSVYRSESGSTKFEYLALNAQGEELWRTTAFEGSGWSQRAELLAVTDEVFINAEREVWSTATGEFQFTLPMASAGGDTFTSGAVITDGRIVLLLHSFASDPTRPATDSLHAFDARSGAPLWHRNFPKESANAPLLSSRGTLVITTGQERLKACAPTCARNDDDDCTGNIDGYDSTLHEITVSDGCDVRACPLPGRDLYKGGVLTRDHFVGVIERRWNDCSVSGSSNMQSLSAFELPGLDAAR